MIDRMAYLKSKRQGVLHITVILILMLRAEPLPQHQPSGSAVESGILSPLKITADKPYDSLIETLHFAMPTAPIVVP